MSIDKKQLSKLVYYMSTFDGGCCIKECSFIMNMREENLDYISWVEENLDYISWVEETLSNITSVTKKLQPNYNTDGYNRKPLIRMWTKSHPYFSKVRERIYIDNKKILDPQFLLDDRFSY